MLTVLGVGVDPGSLVANVVHGALWFLPVFLVCNAVGGFWEALFSMIRRHEVNEGFLVTGMLFPLTLPPTIPLWQVAVGISFGVVIGKEIFGGTGKNFLNPALTARAFLYFAYPVEITGDRIWVAVDGYSRATPLGQVPADGIAPMEAGLTKMQAFLGVLPGSMGETSVLACLIGAVILIATGIGSWRIMASMTATTFLLAWLLHQVDSQTNHMFALDPVWHLLLGGFAFGCVYMATDPVSASFTDLGKWLYGALIGVMTVLIRVVNPAFPEGGDARYPLRQHLRPGLRLPRGAGQHPPARPAHGRIVGGRPWPERPSAGPSPWPSSCASSARSSSPGRRWCCGPPRRPTSCWTRSATS